MHNPATKRVGESRNVISLETPVVAPEVGLKNGTNVEGSVFNYGDDNDIL